MNQRREAMKKFGMGVLGLAAMGGSRGGPASQGPGDVAGWSGTSDTAQSGFYGKSLQQSAPLKRDPARMAREKAAEPLREAMERLNGFSGWNVREYNEHNWDHGQRRYKSTSEWFRNCVAMDRAKERTSLMNKLRAEYESLLRGPLDKLSEEFQSAVAEALKEFS